MYLINFQIDNYDSNNPTADINFFTKKSLLLPIFAQQGGHLSQGINHWTERQQDYGMYYLQFTIDGNGILKYENNTFSLNKGDIILIDSKNYHYYKTGNTGYWKYCYINLYGDMCKILYSLLYNEKFKLYNIDNVDECVKLFDSIYLKMRIRTYKENIEISRLLIDFFHKIAFQNTNDSEENLKELDIDFIIKYIQSNFTNGISISHLSKEFNFTEEYFIRKFKKNIGITPYQYITKLKIDYAKSMLLNTNKSINLISELCGFKNLQNMINCFNKFEKTSPLKYKKNILGKIN